MSILEEINTTAGNNSVQLKELTNSKGGDVANVADLLIEMDRYISKLLLR